MPRPALPSRLASFRLAILLLFLVPMVVTVMVIVHKMSERAEAVVYQLSSRIVDEVAAKVVARAAGIVRLAEAHLLSNAAVAAAHRPIPGQALFADLFWQQVILTPELTGMFIGDRDGNFVQARTEPEPATRVIDRTVAPPVERVTVRAADYRPIAHLERSPELDPRERPWYRGTRAERRLQWTDVYRFSSTGRLGITATYPLLDQEDRILAVLGADATLDSLSEFLSRQDIGRNSAAFLLDDRDRLIAYPRRLELTPGDPDGGGLVTLSETGVPWVTNALASIGRLRQPAAVEHGVRSITDGKIYLTHVVAFEEGFGLPWRLVVVVSESDLLSQAQRALQEAIVVSAIIVTIALFVVYPLAASFAGSVEQLTRNTRMLRLFRPAEVVPVPSAFREIREMDEAIRGLRDTLVLVEGQLPGEAIRQLASGRTPVRLAAEVKPLTVMASALEDPDTLFATHQPDQIMDFLADQIQHGGTLIGNEDGTLEEVRGDRIHGFWDTPAQPDRAARQACRAALAFSRSCAPDAARHGLPADVVRHIGLQSGQGLVGNPDLSGRLRYGAMGRLVAEAAWLRDANRRYGTRILIGERLRRLIEERFLCRPLDWVKLPGEDRAGPIYELRAEADGVPDPGELAFILACELGVARYRDGRWDEAIVALQEARGYVPDDRACGLLIERCERLRDGCELVAY